MKVYFRNSFKKQYRKLPAKVQKRFSDRLDIYITHGSHDILRVHTLKGNKYPLQSMNITGDYRALFIATKTKITFYEIGIHSELYE